MTDQPLESLTNLGRIAARQLAEVGIASETDLRNAGAVGAYLRLKEHFGPAVSLNYLYALDGALKGVRWDLMPESERAALRAEAAAQLSRRSAAGARPKRRRSTPTA
jgi:DNA transformation protein